MDLKEKSHSGKHGYLSGKRVLPRPVSGESDIAAVIHNMDAYNGGRLRAACQLMRDKGVTRIYDILFDYEDVLMETDRRRCKMLLHPEFQKEVTVLSAASASSLSVPQQRWRRSQNRTSHPSHQDDGA